MTESTIFVWNPLPPVSPTSSEHAEAVTSPDRLSAYEDLIERINAAYTEGPIDWALLKSIESRILSAATWAELDAAVVEYEAAAIPELINQPTL